MLYLSQILNTKVLDSADKKVGKLVDILIPAENGLYPQLNYILIKNRKGEEFYLSFDKVENFSSGVINLKTQIERLEKITETPGQLFLTRDVLDQQIVDMEGARVVRVNDLKIGVFNDKMSVLGIDISFRGILRALGVEFFDIFDFFKVELIDWRNIQPVNGHLKLDTVAKKLNKLHPADLANIVEDLGVKQASNLVKSLDKEAAAKVFEEIEPNLQQTMVRYLDADSAIKIVQEMPDDELVDLVKSLPKPEAIKILSHLQKTELSAVQNLLRYSDDTAGGLMTTVFVSARPEWTAEKMITEIKNLSDDVRILLYIYVTKENGEYCGSVSLRRLITADKNTLLQDIMKPYNDLAVLYLSQDINEVIDVMTKYNLYTAAVLDDNKKILGIVTIDDVMRHLKPNA